MCNLHTISVILQIKYVKYVLNTLILCWIWKIHRPVGPASVSDSLSFLSRGDLNLNKTT